MYKVRDVVNCTWNKYFKIPVKSFIQVRESLFMTIYHFMLCIYSYSNKSTSAEDSNARNCNVCQFKPNNSEE